jgi:hypothetical protein
MKKPISHYITHYISNIYGVIICIPLGFGGLYLLYQVGSVAINNDKISDPAVIVILAIIFIFSLLCFAGSYRSVKKIIDSEREFDDEGIDLGKEPWLANKEWREKRITGYSQIPGHFHISPILIWIGVFFLLFLPTGILLILFISYGMYVEIGTFLVMFLIVDIWLWDQYRKKRKFGKSICHLNTLPIWIGQHIEAEIEIEFPRLRWRGRNSPDHDIEVALQCRSVSGTGRHVRIKIVQEYKKEIAKGNILSSGDGTLVIPIHIDVPKSAEDSGSWRLEVKTTFSGIGYKYYFNVPVVSSEKFGVS